MSPAPPYEDELFTHPTEISSTVVVNDRVCIQTEEDQRVISVHGVVFSHYSIKDRTAEAYAMVLLFESGYADQNDIARCFGYSARSLRRYQERLRAGGLGACAPAGKAFRAQENPEARPNHSPPENQGDEQSMDCWAAGPQRNGCPEKSLSAGLEI